MDLKRENDEVFYVTDPICRIGKKEITFIKSAAQQNRRKRARICTHPDAGDRLHEMLIVLARDTYVRPHRHLSKSESFHVIEGILRVIIFDEDGAIIEQIPLGEAGNDHDFYYRLSHDLYHSVIPESEWVVFHEVTRGPFDRSQTVFPSWAPLEGEDYIKEQGMFLKDLSRSAGI